MSIAPMPIFLFTDFGPQRIYVAQMEAAVYTIAPHLKVIDLCNDAPGFDPTAAAQLLAALAAQLPWPAVVLGVVDPGVGSERRPVVVRSGGLLLVGPDNGLFAPLLGPGAKAARIDWRPSTLSDSFHGRDLFAPIAAQLALGRPIAETALDEATLVGAQTERQPSQIIYVDHYGNLFTGLRAHDLTISRCLMIHGRRVCHAATFSAVERGGAFWYVNSLGLVEIAVNCGSAAERFNGRVGDRVILA